MAARKEQNIAIRGAPSRSAAPLTSPSYLIIGSGKIARHFEFYLKSLELRVQTWSRDKSSVTDLATEVAKASHILLLISDSAIEGFYEDHLKSSQKPVIHFSGALSSPSLLSAHPLMTFGPELYSPEFYRQIYFVISGADDLSQILPGLPNSFSVLKESDRALYHALCVVGGNFTAMLLQKMILGFQKLGLPAEASRLYIEQTVANIFSNPTSALTGPLIRHDAGTVEKNLAALTGDSYQNIYRAFLKDQWPEFPGRKS